MSPVVVDASALVDLLVDNDRAPLVRQALIGRAHHAPAHLDAEVLSALGRLRRAGLMTNDDVGARLSVLARSLIERHPLPALVEGAWARHARLRLVDALYAELADRLGATLVTCDAGLAAQVPGALLIEHPSGDSEG